MLSTSRPRTASFALSICTLLSAGALLALGDARPARAQQADTAETDTTIQVETTTRKSPSRAQLYSLGATMVPLIGGLGSDNAPLWAAGIFIGPSVGHFYAENTSQALTGIGLRVGGSALLVLGAGAAVNSGGSSGGSGSGVLLVGGLLGLVSAGYDIFTADDAARDYNEAHGLKSRVAPAVGPQGEQMGFSLQVQF
jgi:hypothetical protein